MFEFKWSPLLDAEGDIGAASGDGAASSEPSSVATGDDTPAEGIAPAAASGSEGGEGTPDVTQQESFATRLKQEREKIEQEYQPHRQRADRVEQIAKAAGFANVDDYFAAVDNQLKERQAAEEAQRLGLDPETYNQFFAPVRDELSQTKQELAKLQQADLERQIRADYDRLKSQYPDFAEVENQVWELATERRLPLEDAFKLVSYDARIAAVKQETEQQVLANVTGRDQKQVLTGKDKGGQAALDPGNMSLSDIEAISQRVQRGERITF